MATLEKEIGLEHLNLMQKRLEILLGGRVMDRDKMIEAAKSIDILRRKVDGWNSVQEIRKWRDKK